jgi:hypothetical protein
LAQSRASVRVDARKILAACSSVIQRTRSQSWPAVDAERARPSVPCRYSSGLMRLSSSGLLAPHPRTHRRRGLGSSPPTELSAQRSSPAAPANVADRGHSLTRPSSRAAKLTAFPRDILERASTGHLGRARRRGRSRLPQCSRHAEGALPLSAASTRKQHSGAAAPRRSPTARFDLQGPGGLPLGACGGFLDSRPDVLHGTRQIGPDAGDGTVHNGCERVESDVTAAPSVPRV